jgi:hypothetical protein
MKTTRCVPAPCGGQSDYLAVNTVSPGQISLQRALTRWNIVFKSLGTWGMSVQSRHLGNPGLKRAISDVPMQHEASLPVNLAASEPDSELADPVLGSQRMARCASETYCRLSPDNDD